MAAAIDRHTIAVGRRIDQPCVRAWSTEMAAWAEIDLTALTPDPALRWSSYLKAAFGALVGFRFDLAGMELVIHSDIPIGAGLSSSAAFEAAVANAVLTACDLKVEPAALARALQQGENHYAGVQCGMLDQFSSICGRAGRVLYLDCATCDYEALPLGDPPPVLVVADSRVSRELGGEAPYNQRRAECEQAKAILEARLGRTLPGLCRASLAELEASADRIPEPALSRARHVIGEHERVRAARQALLMGDVDLLGSLLEASHVSSQQNFENSCEELDRLCAAAAGQPGYIGARLCGGGWGGCTINLVHAARVDAFVTGLERAAAPWSGPAPAIRICQAAEGARGVRL